MKRVLLAALAIAALLVSLAGTVVAAAPADNPGKGPVDKVVFVHYPKDTPGRPDHAGGGGGGGAGVLSANYKYSGIHWADPTAIEYWVNPDGSGVNNNTAVTALQAAFAAWDNACGPLGYSYQKTTTRQGGVLDGYNVVSWVDISAQYPNAIAVTSVWYYRYTKTIVEVDTQMNSAFRWSYTPVTTLDLSGPAVPDTSRYADPGFSGTAGTYDIRDIMTHEAGHWIMLGDLYGSRDAALTMYGYGSTGEISKDTLGYGDERGVEAVYEP